MDSVVARRGWSRINFRVNKFFFCVVVYFFLNSVGLPHGLLYTTILSPIFYLWLLKNRKQWIVSRFVVFFMPFVVVHLAGGVVDLFMYFRSFVLCLGVYITLYAAAVGLRNNSRVENIFDKIIFINFILTCFALLLLSTPYVSLMWSVGRVTSGIGVVARLRMFTYEPSYYATLLVPFVVYSLTTFVDKPSRRNILMVASAVIPFLLSFSFGVISALTIAVFITVLFKNFRVVKKPVVLFVVVLAIGCGMFLFFTDNLFSHRLHNLLVGADSSGRNRIFESTDIGYRVAESTNLFFGSGFGQAKFYLPDLFEVYWEGLRLYRLTNVLADTLATLGLIGVIIRLVSEMVLFLRTHVYRDLFRLVLFLFVFVYQFTGSYLTNVAEYVIWLLAFYPVLVDRARALLLRR